MGIAVQERPVFTLLLAQGGEFAFVVFQAAAGAKVFSAETASLLIGAVAVSMLVSPLLLVAIDKLAPAALCQLRKPARWKKSRNRRMRPSSLPALAAMGKSWRLLLGAGHRPAPCWTTTPR
jgi:hypothetical protein